MTIDSPSLIVDRPCGSSGLGLRCVIPLRPGSGGALTVVQSATQAWRLPRRLAVPANAGAGWLPVQNRHEAYKRRPKLTSAYVLVTTKAI